MERAIEDAVDFAELGEFLHQPLYEVESACRIHSAVPGASGSPGAETRPAEEFGNRARKGR
jgi:hypothetical protein